LPAGPDNYGDKEDPPHHPPSDNSDRYRLPREWRTRQATGTVGGEQPQPGGDPGRYFDPDVARWYHCFVDSAA